jgi:hypothetical protein
MEDVQRDPEQRPDDIDGEVAAATEFGMTPYEGFLSMMFR